VIIINYKEQKDWKFNGFNAWVKEVKLIQCLGKRGKINSMPG
jgi:hypothetical protein